MRRRINRIEVVGDRGLGRTRTPPAGYVQHLTAVGVGRGTSPDNFGYEGFAGGLDEFMAVVVEASHGILVAGCAAGTTDRRCSRRIDAGRSVLSPSATCRIRYRSTRPCVVGYKLEHGHRYSERIQDDLQLDSETAE